jgi:colanic acid/amylovoran biosynthesis protein
MEVEDDYRVIVQIKELYKDNSNVIVAPKFTSPIEAKSYISQMDFFIGSRMHSTIASLSSGVATVPIAYSRKFSGVFGSIDYPYTLDAYGNDSGQTSLHNDLMRLYDEHYEEMSHAAESSLIKAKKRLNIYVTYLAKALK